MNPTENAKEYAFKTKMSGCKEILLRKLSYAVICSVVSQVVILCVFLFIINFDVLRPLNWLLLTFQTLTSVSTWLFMIPFSSIIFAQSLICAKDYVLTASYSSSRVQKFLSVFSLRNLVLLILHFMVGGLMVWLFLSLGGGQYENLMQSCKEGEKCFVEGTFYLILSGLWTGIYFFVKVYVSDKKIIFPVVYQHKLLQFKSRLLPLIGESKNAAIWPTIYFVILYYIFGLNIKSYVTHVLGTDTSIQASGTMIYVYAWLFSVLYFVNMNLMRFFFELFLTEPVEFPIISVSNDDLCLADAIEFSTIPIIQHLACLDLYLLSQWSNIRRHELFSLSQPGGHPQNWNYLIQKILKLLSEYSEGLNKSTTAILVPENPVILKSEVAPIQNPVYSPKYPLMRNMVMLEDNNLDINVTYRQKLPSINTETVAKYVAEKLNIFTSGLKRKLGFHFFFGELPEANIQYCLGNGQIVMWVTQGIASLTAASLTEDRYGIVQKDLPVIITSLVELKTNVEKLNRVPALNKKSLFDDFNSKMKVGMNASIKRSLFGICSTFGQYLKDLPLNKEVVQHLQTFVYHK